MDDGQSVGRSVGRARSPTTVIDLENDFLKPYTTLYDGEARAEREYYH